MPHPEEEFVRQGVREYIASVFGAPPRSLYPGKDPLWFWRGPTPGRDTFSYVPPPDVFERIAREIGIERGHTVAHPYALDESYKKLLERQGAVVHSFDLSAESAIRSGSKIADAERLVDYTKRKYDHFFAFEPTSLFLATSGPVKGILALASALNIADRVHIAYSYNPRSSEHHMDFEALFRWLANQFGGRVEKRTYPAGSRELFAVTTISIPDEAKRKQLLELARLLHKTVVQGLPADYTRRVILAGKISDEKAETHSAPLEMVEKHADRVVQRMKRTRWGDKTLYDVFKDLLRAREEVRKEYSPGKPKKPIF
ncbi:MAG: hypothetical protein PWP76_360 [Candidatus Diapherotrites archaeon]|nr:hypothetical protein [Candidatus Diapherotrites archaeon]MDN5367221.1 hypothetical protein [Candidatus Diapherotrites archaeon]